MDAHQLWETTMDPKTRTLVCVTIDNARMAEKRVSELMGGPGGFAKKLDRGKCRLHAGR